MTNNRDFYLKYNNKLNEIKKRIIDYKYLFIILKKLYLLSISFVKHYYYIIHKANKIISNVKFCEKLIIKLELKVFFFLHNIFFFCLSSTRCLIYNANDE